MFGRRSWKQAADEDAELQGDLAYFGVDPDSLPGEKPGLFEVDEDNWNAVMLFMAMSSQWRTSMAGGTGLDYNVLDTVERRTGYSCQTPEDFEALRVIEMASLKEMRDRG